MGFKDIKYNILVILSWILVRKTQLSDLENRQLGFNICPGPNFPGAQLSGAQPFGAQLSGAQFA